MGEIRNFVMKISDEVDKAEQEERYVEKSRITAALNDFYANIDVYFIEAKQRVKPIKKGLF